MKRSELVKKMTNCFNTCKVMQYTDNGAMDRVLEIVEEELLIKQDEVYEEETEEDDNYCGAV